MKLLKMGAIAFFLFSFLLGGNTFGQAVNYPNGSTVADFELIDTDGNTYTLDDMIGSGRYVLLEFMSSDCGICHSSSEIFNEMYDKYGCNSEDVFLITISGLSTDGNAEVEGYNEMYGGDFRHSPIVPGIEGDNSTGDDVAAEFGVDLAPTFCLISPDKVMLNNDIWPVYDVSYLLDEFPPGEEPNEAPCTFASIEEEKVEVELSIYPNPSSYNLNINYDASVNEEVKIEVVNLLGEVVLSQDYAQVIGENQETIDVSTIESGQYFIRISGNGMMRTALFQKSQ